MIDPFKIIVYIASGALFTMSFNTLNDSKPYSGERLKGTFGCLIGIITFVYTTFMLFIDTPIW